MRKREWSVAICLALCACAAPEGDIVASSASPLRLPESCNPRRRVGVPTRGSGCPAPWRGSGWSVAFLFSDPAVITLGGRPFCLYEHTGPRPFTTATLPTDPGTGRAGVRWTDPDCLGVVPLGDSEEVISEVHAAAYRRQVGVPEWLPDVGALPRAVSVAILDSSVTSEPSALEPTTGAFLHGRALSQIIREASCPRGRGEVCIPDFDTYLVLDEGGDGPGGHYGSITTLAQRVEAAILGAATPRVVLPLALGWHPRFQHRNADPGEAVSQAVLAVREALDFATCQGALVLAAAGNRSSGADGSGALCPACWETLGASCDVERPVVHAVGALDGSGAPISLSRDGASARFAGAGFGVSASNRVPGQDEGRPLGVWTGTSMGVASVAAAATLAWGYQPHLSAKDLGLWLYERGAPTGIAAEHCLATSWGGSCEGVRRVEACGILRESLGSACSGCRVPCSARPYEKPRLSDDRIAWLLEKSNPGSLLPSPILDQPIAAPSCAAPVQGDGVYDPARRYCPWELLEGPASEPVRLDAQPGPNGCAVCAIFSLGTQADQIYLSIRKDYPGVLSDPTLTVPGIGSLALGDAMTAPVLSAGDVVAIALPWAQPSYTHGARIDFVYRASPSSTDAKVVSVPLPIY